MKKIILSAIMLIGLTFSAQAQKVSSNSNNALGLRIGDNDGFGAEISYQRKLSPSNRLEFDLGWRNRNHPHYDNNDESSVKLVGLYQWVWNIQGGFNWYAGVGGGFANNKYDYNQGGERYNDSYTYPLIAGDIGIEYNFPIPLMISLDFRPEFYFTDKLREDFGPDVALGIRFTF